MLVNIFKLKKQIFYIYVVFDENFNMFKHKETI